MDGVVPGAIQLGISAKKCYEYAIHMYYLDIFHEYLLSLGQLALYMAAPCKIRLDNYDNSTLFSLVDLQFLCGWFHLVICI